MSPLAVEEVVRSVWAVAAARAYGRRNPITDSIVAVDVLPVSSADVEKIQDEIRFACERLKPAARPRSIRVVDDLTTRGGKVLRSHE